MKMYKGFNKDMTCRGFQFAEGETFTEDNAVLCDCGFHACENPLDCFGYYAPGSSVFHEVDLDATEERNIEDSKRCGKTIKIGARLDVACICKAHFEYVNSKCVPSKSRAAGDKESAAAGNWGSAAAGEQGIVCCRGGKAKGGLGAVLALSEIDKYGRNISAKAVIVDGDTIKTDTWYELKNGDFVEVETE